MAKKRHKRRKPGTPARRQTKPTRYIKTEDNTFVPENFYRVNKPPPSFPRYKKVGKKFVKIGRGSGGFRRRRGARKKK